MEMQICHAQEIKGKKPAWFKKEKTQTLSNEIMSLISEGSYEDCNGILGACNFT